MTLSRAVSLVAISATLGAALLGFLLRDGSVLSWVMVGLAVVAAVGQTLLLVLNGREMAKLKKKTDLAYALSAAQLGGL